ncbi:hypothetical protein [Gluconobacter roseus]|uniref:Uncharacterized protein n=1 Tax=Gluconobacter roseus NBRC 3990 TaxID=1307950 RepID=A0A4Y3M7J0_9PROT|nr:hypothetical protein [Gluconobacter roseus]GEB03241.1 hypothetical protein GRO01_08170 [Gluconobacter roseus NBRC 3990]GLP93699.1 hypothetical protein GCM10007871_16770 [Gluconobacter roseus NBRC 3990]
MPIDPNMNDRRASRVKEGQNFAHHDTVVNGSGLSGWDEGKQSEKGRRNIPPERQSAHH